MERWVQGLAEAGYEAPISRAMADQLRGKVGAEILESIVADKFKHAKESKRIAPLLRFAEEAMSLGKARQADEAIKLARERLGDSLTGRFLLSCQLSAFSDQLTAFVEATHPDGFLLPVPFCLSLLRGAERTPICGNPFRGLTPRADDAFRCAGRKGFLPGRCEMGISHQALSGLGLSRRGGRARFLDPEPRTQVRGGGRGACGGARWVGLPSGCVPPGRGRSSACK